jgi:hypothetical protein
LVNKEAGMRRVHIIVASLVLLTGLVSGDRYLFDDNWRAPGFNLTSESQGGVEVIYSLPGLSITDFTVEGRAMKVLGIPGICLPNDEGAPNLPGAGRIIAIPRGARPKLRIVSTRTEIIKDVEIAPAPRIPFDVDDSPLEYSRDESIYSVDAYYPAQPVALSEPFKMHGVDVVILGITPFQYNPVTRELVVYKDIEVSVDFDGGDGSFGDNRLRSRWWEPILEQHLINYGSLGSVDLFGSLRYEDGDGYEYVIIIPDDPDFEAWADTIKTWRKLQGISTEVFKLSEIGGNTFDAIETFVDDAYTNWAIPPVAVLLLSDYESSGKSYGITSRRLPHPYSGTYVSDNWYADVDGDTLPDINFARITAQDASDLEETITKFLGYERNPYADAGFYDHPLIACGFQTERWFQLCSETIYGFFEKELGKSPVRQHKIYAGSPSPGDTWSTGPNTAAVVDYFGESGLGYICDTIPNGIDWDGGSAAGINSTINSGTFLIQHRDHGSETGWGEPSYHISDLSGLSNTMLPFVFSVNCLTGRFDHSTHSFAEAFHRMQHGALGVIAASQVSYSFVNDTYVWGIYDCLWPQFDPGYPSTKSVGHSNLRPAFANTSAKYYLAASSWPYSNSMKSLTYNLFHHHGDPFITLYSEMPESLTVAHLPTLTAGTTMFPVTADDSSIIALTVSGDIIGVAEGTGTSQNISMPMQVPGDTVVVTVTKANYYRYMSAVPIIADSTAYVAHLNHTLYDTAGNGDGIIDRGETIVVPLWVKNYGSEIAVNVEGKLSSVDTFIVITDSVELFGTIESGDSAGTSSYVFDVNSNCPNNHTVQFNLVCQDSLDSTWISGFTISSAAYLASVTPPSQDSFGFTGDTVWYTLTVKNKGTSPDSFDLSAIGNSWTTTLWESTEASQITNTGQVLADSSVDIRIRIEIPGGAANGEIDTVEVHAASTVYPSVSDYGRVVTSARAMYSIPFHDGFESGLTNWNLSGTDNWAIYAGTGERGTGGAYQGDSVMVLTCAASGTNSWSYSDVYLELAEDSCVFLDFYWRAYSLTGSEYIYLDIYDGIWHTGIDSLTGNDTDWENVHLDLSGYDMIDGFIVRFRAYMNYVESSDAAYVDTVRIYTPDFGSIAGTVTDAGTALPVEGAIVEILGAGLLDTSDASGEYQVSGIETGTYDVTCTASGYLSRIESDVPVLVDDTTIVDFAMTAPDIEVSPDSLGASLALNDSITDTLFISNTGTDTLVFNISESHTIGLESSYHESRVLSLDAEKEPAFARGTGNSFSDLKATAGPRITTVDWLSENLTSGSVLPGETDTILVAFNATGLAPDSTYRAWLKINSNDPDEQIVSVPCTLYVQSAPVVSYSSHIIDDDSTGESAGNNDAVAEAGETIEMPVALTNTGSDSAYGVSAIISTADTFITLSDTVEDFGDISPDSTKLCLDDYVFSVDPACPDSHTVTFVLDITEVSHSWIDTFDVVIRHYSDISGQITDKATGLGIPGAMVTYTGQATGVDTADGTGNYQIPDMAGGTYLLTASAAGFLNSNPVNVTIPPDTVIDFVLGAPDIQVSPDSLAASLTLDDSTTRTLLISNTGTDTLTFTIFESDSGVAKLANVTSVKKAGRRTRGGSTLIAGADLSHRKRLPFSSANPSPFVSPSPLSSNEDTICYDDSTASWYLNAANAYYAVRFTPTEGCRVLAGLAMAYDPNAVGAPCSLFVWDDNGGVPGSVVAGPIAYTPLAYPNWDRVSLPLPVRAAGDFHLGYWVPGDPTGQYGLLDNDGGARSLQSTDGGASWTALGSNGDLMIRAIVEYDIIEWLSEDPVSGSVPPGEVDTVLITFNSTGLVLDSTYKAWINVGSNDLDEPVVLMPVTLTVADSSLPKVTVVSPDSGELWIAGASDTIRWEAMDDNGIDSVSIHLSLDGGSSYPDTIARGEPDDSAYAWVPPDTFSTTCRIKVIVWDAAENRAEDESDHDFLIAHGQKGDVNRDGEVTILDIQRMVNIIQERGAPPTSYELWAADINEDGEINILDIMEAINIIQGYEGTVATSARLLKRIGISVGREISLTGEVRPTLATASSRPIGRAGRSRLLPLVSSGDTCLVSIPSDSGIVGTDSNMIYVNLENLAGVGAVQIRITFDTSLTAREADTTFRSGMMSIDSKIDSNYIQILFFNMSDDTIAPGTGPIIRIPLYISPTAQAGDSTLLSIERIILTDVHAVEIPSQGVNGWFHFRGPAVDGDDILPQKYDLSGVFPNPITRQAMIRYAIPERSHATLKIYDVSGKLVRTLVEGHQKPAYYSVAWLGRDNRGRKLPPGVYFIRFNARSTDASAQARGYESVGKVILAR